MSQAITFKTLDNIVSEQFADRTDAVQFMDEIRKNYGDDAVKLVRISIDNTFHVVYSLEQTS